MDQAQMQDTKIASRFDRIWGIKSRLASIEKTIASLYNEMPRPEAYPAHNEAFAAAISWLEDVAGELRAELRDEARFGGHNE